jgi:hypothetical protein
LKDSFYSGQFWVCFAARTSYEFDDIYWKFIDPIYYGEFTFIEDQIELLGPQEQDYRKRFAPFKIQHAREGGLSEHRTLKEILSS